MTKLITLTAPTCAGKTYLLESLVQAGYKRIVGATDRAPRAGEVHGVHNYFLSSTEMSEMYQRGEFAEYIVYNGNQYGVTKQEIIDKVTDKPGLVILTPHGIKKYHEFAMNEGWSSLHIFVDTPEEIRIDRLMERAYTDATDGLDRLNYLDSCLQIRKAIKVNMHRLVAVLKQESSWESAWPWDLKVSGTDVKAAISSIETALKEA